MPRGRIPSWEMKRTILDLFGKLGRKPEVIQRDIDRLIGRGKPLEGESTPNVKTISNVIDELQELSLSVLRELPRHVQEKRNDWPEIKQLFEDQPEVPDTKGDLTIEFAPERSEDQGPYTFTEEQQARFCCVHVWNRSKSTAQQCVATLRILSTQNARRLSHYNLHWAFDDPYLLTDLARPVDILPGDCRRLDVTFALPPSQNKASEIVVDQGMTTGRRTAIILPSAPTSRDTFEAKAGGCWIATHLALSTYRPEDQYHLAPGDYLVKVEVRWNHGENEAKWFRVFSASDWRKLRMELVECPEATN